MTNIRYEPVKLALVYGCSGFSVSYLRVLPATKFWANIPLNTIFLFRHTLGNELDWVVCIEYWRTVSTDGFHAKSISEKNFFSIRSYPVFDFSEILGLLCPGSSIWFYLHRIDFRTGRRSPKCCWCFIAASLSQGVFATTEILTFTSKH